MEIKQFYETNADFHLYVDRYCKTYRLSVDEALRHELVRQVYLMYAEDAKRIPGGVTEVMNGINCS